MNLSICLLQILNGPKGKKMKAKYDSSKITIATHDLLCFSQEGHACYLVLVKVIFDFIIMQENLQIFSHLNVGPTQKFAKQIPNFMAEVRALRIRMV